MKKHKFSQFATLILITILCYGFVIKAKTPSDKIINTSSQSITTTGTYKVLITHYPGISKAEKVARRNCVASKIGTFIIGIEICSANPNGEILTLGHQIFFPNTTGGDVLPGEDESQDGGVLGSISYKIYLTQDKIMEITTDCSIIVLSDIYDCNDFNDFKHAF